MKTIDLKGSVREKLGKSGTRQVRYDGDIPAVIYGGTDPDHVTVDYLTVEKSLSTPDTYIFNLDVNGKQTPAILREVQFHPVTDRIMHCDFLRVQDGVALELELPIKLNGTPEGVFAGGKLISLMRRIKVKGVPAELPDAVNVNVKHLELGQTIKVRDLQEEGLTITSSPNAGIAMVEISRAARQAAAAAAKDAKEGAK